MSDSSNRSTKQELVDERTELAQHRTEDAARRTVLANERTFSAWLRTALSAIGVGLAVPKLLAPADYHLLALSLGLTLIVLGVGMGLLAAKRYCQITRELEAKDLELTPGWVASIIVIALTLVGVLSVLIVLMD